MTINSYDEMANVRATAYAATRSHPSDRTRLRGFGGSRFDRAQGA